MSSTDRFTEMVEKARKVRSGDEPPSTLWRRILTAAGVPELLADLEEADAHVDARDAENERLHEEVGLLQPVLIAADLVVREWQLGHHPVPTMLVQAVYEVRQHDREAPAVPDDDRSEEVAGGS